MRTISEIAKTYKLNYDVVYRAANRLHINPVLKGNKISYYDQYQEELIVDNLFYVGRIEYVIFESKMNKPEEQEPFEEFKRRTYTNYKR